MHVCGGAFPIPPTTVLFKLRLPAVMSWTWSGADGWPGSGGGGRRDGGGHAAAWGSTQPRAAVASPGAEALSQKRGSTKVVRSKPSP